MPISSFWLLKKQLPSQEPMCGKPSCILELNEDGMGFLWPTSPEYEYLCENCIHAACATPDICHENVRHDLPCRFSPSREIDHQDFDSYLREGDCLDAGGYYNGVYDFLRGNNIPVESLDVIAIGAYRSVLEARIDLQKM